MVNHERLDQILNWTPYLKVDNTCAEEFEALRRLEKTSGSQTRRIKHLEWHLDRNDLTCDCYERAADFA